MAKNFQTLERLARQSFGLQPNMEVGLNSSDGLRRFNTFYMTSKLFRKNYSLFILNQLKSPLSLWLDSGRQRMRSISTNSIVTVYTLGGFAGYTLESAKEAQIGTSITLGLLPPDLIQTTVRLLDDIRKENLLRRWTGRSRLTYNIENCGSGFAAVELDGKVIYIGQTFAPVPDQVVQLINVVKRQDRRCGSPETKNSPENFR
jgi:hypothetical protein